MAIDRVCAKTFSNGAIVFPLVNESTIFDSTHLIQAAYHSFTEMETNGRWYPGVLEAIERLSFVQKPHGKIEQVMNDAGFQYAIQQRANCPLPFLLNQIHPQSQMIIINFTEAETAGNISTLIGHCFKYQSPISKYSKRFTVVGCGSSGKQGKVFAVDDLGLPYFAEYLESCIKYDTEVSRLGLSMCDGTAGSLRKNMIFAELKQGVVLKGHHTDITPELMMKLIELNEAHIIWDGLNLIQEGCFKTNEECQKMYPLEKVIWYDTFGFNVKSPENYTVNQTLQPRHPNGELKSWMKRILKKQDELLMLQRSRGKIALKEYLRSSARLREYDEALEFESFEAEKFLNDLKLLTGNDDLVHYASQTPMLRDTLSKSEIQYRAHVLMGETETLINGYAEPTFLFEGESQFSLVVPSHSKYNMLQNGDTGICLRYPVMSDTATPSCVIIKDDCRSKNLEQSAMSQFRLNCFDSEKKIIRVDKGCEKHLPDSFFDKNTIIPISDTGEWLEPVKTEKLNGINCMDNTKIDRNSPEIQTQQISSFVRITKISNSFHTTTARYANAHRIGVPFTTLKGVKND